MNNTELELKVGTQFYYDKSNTLEFELITAAAAFALSEIESLKKKKRWKSN